MKKNVFKILFSLLITVLMCAFIVWYLLENKDVLSNLTDIELYFLFPVFLLMILTLFWGGLVMKFLVEPFNVNLENHFWVSVSTAFFNMIAPFSGGVGARAVYLKKKYKLSYADFVSSMFGNYVLIFLLASLIALFVFLYIFLKTKVYNLLLVLSFLGIFLVTFVFLIFRFRFKRVNFFTTKVNKVFDGWQIIVSNKVIMWKLVLVLILNILTVALINFILFWALGSSISFFASLYLAVMGVLVIFINFTPGGLGISEFLYFVSASILFVPAPLAVLVALIYRAVRMIVVLGLGGISNLILYKTLQK